MPGIRFFPLICLLVWLAGTQAVFAVMPATGWYSRVWQTDDGLPSANVTSVAQTKDGYLWLGTQTGFARFDGFKLDTINIPLGRARPMVRVMLCDHSERFWFAEDYGVVICMGRNGSNAVMFTPTNGLPDSTPVQIAETGDHAMWIAYAEGTVCRIGTDNRVIQFNEDAGLKKDGTACSLAVDAGGLLWFAKSGVVGTFESNKFNPKFQVNERNLQILPSRSGNLWVGTSTHLLKCQPTGETIVMADFGSTAARFKVTDLFEDSAGRLWIGTAANGLFMLQDTNFFSIETSQNKIQTVTEDREGNIWVGTDGGGLDRLRERVIELRGRDAGMPFETVRSLGEDNAGNLWVITQDGAVTRLTGPDWNAAQTDLGWPGGLAHCVSADNAGSVWIGTFSRGLYRWRDGIFSRYTTKDGLGGSSVRSLLVGRNGDLWIGLENGMVQRFHEGKFESFSLPEGSKPARAMVEDATGQIWMGTINGRVLRWHDGQIEDMTKEMDNESHPIRCMSFTPDGTLWIGFAAGGLGRLKAGHFSRIGYAQGLYDNNICAFMPDESGRMWLAADRGIFQVDLAQLNEVAGDPARQLNCTVYGRDDGLPGLQAYYGYSPGAVRTRSGTILFPTHSGVALVHPERTHANVVAPMVFIEQVSMSGAAIDFPAAGGITRFAPGMHNLEITFTSPSYIAPEQVRFQYRLAGWNDSWVDAGHDRSVRYERLPQGSYVFHVRAHNNSGVESTKDATFRFVLNPYFWQRPYFSILIGMTFALALAALVWNLSLTRARNLLRRAEEASALQRERERIAQDMHDDLGAQFTQISLLGELARTTSEQPEKSAEYLGKISAVARAGVKSLDGIVWAVNPRNDMLPDLLDYSGQYALSFLSAAGIHCRLDFEDNPPDREVSGELRHGIFLIIKEALNNVVRHSQAKNVRLVFDCDQEKMQWSIRDDGVGFAEAPDDALADGLRNMRQRASALGGEVTIISSPGAGTKIRLVIPWRPNFKTNGHAGKMNHGSGP